MDGSRIREMVKKNIGPELSFKIWIWQETGNDESVNGFMDIADTDNPGAFFFWDIPVSKLAEIAGLNGVQYIEIEL